MAKARKEGQGRPRNRRNLAKNLKRIQETERKIKQHETPTDI
jgi:hypothetical protein